MNTKCISNSLALLLMTLLLPAFCVAAPVQAAEDKEFRITILGDQLSRASKVPTHKRWVSGIKYLLFEHHEALNANVTNLSSNKTNTRSLLESMRSVIKINKPDLVVIAVGSLDPASGYTLRFTEQNLVQSIRRAKRAGVDVLLVGVKLPSGFQVREREGSRAMYRRIAKQNQVQLAEVDLARVFRAFDISRGDKDFIQLLAQRALLSAVWPVLKPMLPKQ